MNWYYIYMLTLLLGPDDYTKQAYIRDLAQKAKLEVETYNDPATLPSVAALTQQSLFSAAKLFVLSGIFSKLDWDGLLKPVIESKNEVVVIEEKLDKRLTGTKTVMAHKAIKIVEFALPHGKQLDAWILKRVKELNGAISQKAVDLLAKKLGRDNAQEMKFGGKILEVTEVFNLWRVESEIQKLLAYANGQEIQPNHVEALVYEEIPIDALEITNALGEKNKQRVLTLMHGFLNADTASDEKAGAIQLSALLAEQLRSVAIVQDFLHARVPESVILEKTGWKSGRLFIMKKVASLYPQKTITGTLVKLDALDTELKTSSVPPKVLLDLIVGQLL